MRRPSPFFPVSNRDLTPVLVPTVQYKSLEQLVAQYMTTGDDSGFSSKDPDSYDFADYKDVDMDKELIQSMGKIEAVLHYRNIADARRGKLEFETASAKQQETSTGVVDAGSLSSLSAEAASAAEETSHK